MLARKVTRNTVLLTHLARNFGAAHGHDAHDHHGDHHGDHHDDHHDDHHHVEKADPDHKFIASNTDKKMLVFTGLRASHNAHFELDNIYRHHNDLGLLQ